MANQQEYDARGEALIRREEVKYERAKAKAKALEQNMEETFANLLKQETVKRALAKEAMAATRDTGARERIFAKAGNGAYDEDRDGVVTGFESRPWER